MEEKGAGGAHGCCQGRGQGKREERPNGLSVGFSQGAFWAPLAPPAVPFWSLL